MMDHKPLYQQNEYDDGYEYDDEDRTDAALDTLLDSRTFPGFAEGLLELLQKKGCPSAGIKGCTAFLYEKMQGLPSDIRKETLQSWLSGRQRPKIEQSSRSRMYELCFALQLDYAETVDFFRSVYCDRAFNCHDLQEAVYTFAFLHHCSYAEAQHLLKRARETVSRAAKQAEPKALFTSRVRQTILRMEDEEELLQFFSGCGDLFDRWNQTASAEAHRLVDILLGQKEKSSVKVEKLKVRASDACRAGKSEFPLQLQQYGDCGLLLQEILLDAVSQQVQSPAEYILEETGGIDVFSRSFLLRKLVSTENVQKKEKAELPYLLRSNFPTKKLLSDILSEKKISVSVSYDSIRKMLILLDFYRFWIALKLDRQALMPRAEPAEIYEEETNALLQVCGYENLYAGNPYDWLFLQAAADQDPLGFLRFCLSELLE